ncbi:MAG: HAMP domain-containing protein, partial [Vicinamibacteria bacterium]
MSFLARLSIGRKLLVLTASSVITLSIVAWVGYRSVADLRSRSEAANMHVDAVRYLMQADMEHDAIRAFIYRVLLAAQTNDGAEKDAALTELDKFEKDLNSSLAEVRKLPLNSGTLQALDRLRLDLDAYLSKAHAIAADVRGGRVPRALAALPDFQSTFERLAMDLERTDDLVNVENDNSHKETLRSAALGTQLTIATALIGTVAALFLGLFMARVITTPLKRMTDAATRISRGDLLADVRSNTADESGVLASAFIEMTQYLRGLASAADRISGGDLAVEIIPRSSQDVLSQSFKTMVERLRGTSGKIQEGTDILATSIAQIAAATAQLSASVAETSA